MHLIVLVEDSKPDAELLKTVISEIDIDIDVLWFKNGEECVNYFSEANLVERSFSNEKKILMIIDLNMPKINGLELLDILSKDDVYQKIPKVVYTTSSSEQDVRNAYAKGALSYIIKPFDLDEVTTKVNSLIEYWLEIVNHQQLDFKRELIK